MMMTAAVCEPPLPSLSPLPQADFVKIRTIELFIIPTTTLNFSGYEAFMRVSTDKGFGWSKAFLLHSEKPKDWCRWSEGLTKKIGTTTLTGVERPDYIFTGHDWRQQQLVAEAIGHMTHSLDGWEEAVYNGDELLDLAQFYVTYF